MLGVHLRYFVGQTLQERLASVWTAFRRVAGVTFRRRSEDLGGTGAAPGSCPCRALTSRETVA